MKKIYNNSIVKITDEEGMRYFDEDNKVVELIEEEIDNTDYEDYYYDSDRTLDDDELKRPFIVITQVQDGRNKYCAIAFQSANNNEEKDRYFIVLRNSIVHIDDAPQTTTSTIIKSEIPSSIESTLNRIEEKLSEKTTLETAIIEGIVEKGKEISVEDIKTRLKVDLDKYIQETYGILPKKIVFEDGEVHKEVLGIFHKEFENICKMVKKNIPVMLTGPAGAGKNHTIEQVADALDLDFYCTNSITQEYKLTGFIDANGKYHETEFYKAFTKGGVLLIDEIDASIPEVLIIINSAIANKYFDFPIGRVQAHENFRIVVAGNTYGTGADMIYVGRNVLDGATLDRFVPVEFNYDEEVEKQLAYDEELFNFIKELRRVVNENSLRYIISMRATINASKLLEIGFSKDVVLKRAIIKNMKIDDINIIIKKFTHQYGDWYNELLKLVK